MRCPECQKYPFRLFAIRFFGGVGLRAYLRGYIKCARCGALLKVLGYDRQFWYILPICLVLITGILLGVGWIVENRTTFVWIFLVAALGIGLGIGFIVSRYTRVEKVSPGNRA